MRRYTPGSRRSAVLSSTAYSPHPGLDSATLKVLGGILEKSRQADEPAARWSVGEEKPGESRRVRTQREGFRSFVLELTQAWNLFFNDIRDLAGPAASGTESRASL